MPVTNRLSVRQATVYDVEELISAYQTVYADPPWNETSERSEIRDLLRERMGRRAQIFIARDFRRPAGERIVGFAMSYLHQPLRVG